tara:strand:+ start:13092 stop:13868 length:777 start_codon:yes stop_codon:yes gene_type:complete
MENNFTNFIDSVKTKSMKILENNKKLSITQKSDNDFVTNLDMSINEIISLEIKEYFGDKEKILSEEDKWNNAQGESFWLIDPLDGTSNMISNLPFISISIAKIENNSVVFGLVIDLIHGEVFHAFKHKGAFKNFNKIENLDTDSNLLSISTGFLKKNLSNSELFNELFSLGKVRNLGSQALSLCYVAEGRLNLCINDEAMPWDDFAGYLILTEAEGKYFALSGLDPNYINNDLLKIPMRSFAFNRNFKNSKKIINLVK